MSFLTSLQLALYALMWALAALAYKDERPALLHWLAYATAAAASAALMAWRPAGPPWWTHTGSSAATMFSLALAGRGVLVFLRVRPWDGAWVGAAGAGLLALLWIGPQDTGARVGAMSLFNTFFLVLAFVQARAAFVAEFGVRLAVLATAPSLALLGMNLFFLQRGLRGVPFDLASASAVATSTWVVTLVSAAVFNCLFLFLVTFRLLQRMRRQAGHDALTGLANRRGMHERLRLEWERSRRYGHTFVAIATDVDHFKRINDQHGHAQGDQALQAVATALQAQVRESDHVSRFGGEEFVVLMPQASATGEGLALAERLRAAVARIQLRNAQGQTIALSASFGVSESRPDDADSELLLRRADQALYQAKRQGRNCVVVHTPTTAPEPET